MSGPGSIIAFPDPTAATYSLCVTAGANTSQVTNALFNPTANLTGNISSVDTATDIITWSVTLATLAYNGFAFTPSGGVWPAPLVAGTTYYIGSRVTTTFKVYPTLADALAATNAIDLTNAGSGTRTMVLQGATIVNKFVGLPSPTIFLTSGSSVKIRMAAPITSGTTVINNVYIGNSASSPAWGFLGTPVQVLFSGSPSVTLVGGTVGGTLSDAITFGMGTASTAVSIAIDIAAQTTTQTLFLNTSSVANYLTYVKAGAHEANAPAATTYNSTTYPRGTLCMDAIFVA